MANEIEMIMKLRAALLDILSEATEPDVIEIAKKALETTGDDPQKEV